MRTSGKKHNAFHGSLARGLCFLLFMFVSLLVHTAYAIEFDLSKLNLAEVAAIPGADMKGGVFRYILKDDRGWDRSPAKAGILVNNKVLYYVESEGGSLDPGGDTNFGVYKDYFVMDSWALDSTGHNRMMYLFRFSRDNKVELLDVLVQAHLGRAVPFDGDFVSETTPIAQKKARWNEREIRYELPLWMDIKDIDNDGNPEIKLRIRTEEYAQVDSPAQLALYIEIANDRLQVDFNPDLYKPLFEKEKSRKTKMNYYIYGFLSGQLGLDEIKAILKKNRDLYKKVVPFLESREELNAAFHEYSGEKPVLKKYIIKRR
ncbi:MAG: hypothetical protein HZB21_07030 [Deltaproteobacteria bacterium]|nr:hypothetical protein [Deltaproteobacteria bacterium]